MNSLAKYLAQAAFYALFFIPVAWLASNPIYEYRDADVSVLKLAIRHAGEVVGECTPLNEQDYANLPANMKRPEICPRERSPLRLELLVNGEPLYSEVVPAAGLHRDGVSSMYRRFELPAGQHSLELTMNDDVSVEGPTWRLQQDVDLAPSQVMVASFNDGFRLK